MEIIDIKYFILPERRAVSYLLFRALSLVSLTIKSARIELFSSRVVAAAYSFEYIDTSVFNPSNFIFIFLISSSEYEGEYPDSISDNAIGNELPATSGLCSKFLLESKSLELTFSMSFFFSERLRSKNDSDQNKNK